MEVTNLKRKNYTNFCKFILLLSGDKSLNTERIKRPPDVNSYHMGTTQQKKFTFSAYKYQQLTFQKRLNKMHCHVGGVAWYIRKDLFFNTRILHCKEMENLVFDILLPKSKSITKGVFYRPPNQVEFMDLMVEKFSNLSLKDTEIYLLCDFNINLFQNGKYFLNE